MICPDVLGNTTRFAAGNAGCTDAIKQRRFAVINVTHDRDDRWTHLEFCIGVADVIGDRSIRIIVLRCNRLTAHFLSENHGRIAIKHLIDGNHLAHLHHAFYQLCCFDRHLVRQFADRDRLWNDNLFKRQIGLLDHRAARRFGTTLVAVAFAAAGTGLPAVCCTSIRRRIARFHYFFASGVFLPRWSFFVTWFGYRGSCTRGWGRFITRLGSCSRFCRAVQRVLC